MKTVADLINKWDSDADLARDIGLNPSHISMMKLRNSIHPRHWTAIIKAARERGIKGINADVLGKIAVNRLKELA